MERKKQTTSSYADNMTIYTENPKGSTKKLLELLELISKFSKAAGYNGNIQKL